MRKQDRKKDFRKVQKNYGVSIELELRHRKPEKDWVFGASSVPCLAEIPEEERDAYLPVGEIQRGLEDFMDCATRAPLNILEAKFNFLYKTNKLPKEYVDFLTKNNYITEKGIEFSDRFVAINSGTTRQGNSLIAPLDAIRKQGLIPKALLPASSDMRWEDYHDPLSITSAMRLLGQQFADRFLINYEQVKLAQFPTLLSKDMIDVAAFAWPAPVNGEYPKTDYQINHAFIIYRTPKYLAFDNYIDTVDGDFVKKLSSNYSFLSYGYRTIISLKKTTTLTWLQIILGFFGKKKVI